MPAPMHNPNLSRGHSTLSTPRTPATRLGVRSPSNRSPSNRTPGQNERLGSTLQDDIALPSTTGSSQKRPPPRKMMPALGVSNKPVKPEVNLAVTVDKPTHSLSSEIITPTQIVPIEKQADNQTPTNQETTQKSEKPKKKRKGKDRENKTENDGEYSSDFESEVDSNLDLVIAMVGEATSTFNEKEFTRRLRALSAESLLPEVDKAGHAQDMADIKQEMSDKEEQHNAWLLAFREKKANILERLGIILKNRSDRFHYMCDIVEKEKGGKAGAVNMSLDKTQSGVGQSTDTNVDTPVIQDMVKSIETNVGKT